MQLTSTNRYASANSASAHCEHASVFARNHHQPAIQQRTLESIEAEAVDLLLQRDRRLTDRGEDRARSVHQRFVRPGRGHQLNKRNREPAALQAENQFERTNVNRETTAATKRNKQDARWIDRVCDEALRAALELLGERRRRNVGRRRRKNDRRIVYARNE